ncbi:MAG: helix-turn-helix domain-containing protein [Thermomicrobiales bacterium]
MPRPYSVDLRERVMAAVTDGRPIIEVAQQFSVSVDAIYDWRRRLAETDALAPTTGHAGRPSALSPDQHALLRDQLTAVPDATIAELQTWLREEHGLVVGWGTVWRAVARLGLTRKQRV